MNNLSRRQLLRDISLSTGCVALAPFLANMRAQAEGAPKKLPKRFVFIARANGLLPYGVQPIGLEKRVNGPSNKLVRTTNTTQLALRDLALHPTMKSLEPLKDRMNIIQGLSAKMCSGNHSAHYGALGVYPMRDGSRPKDITIDSKLAQAFSGIFPHVGLMLGAKGKQVINPRLSASGLGKPLSYYADPLLAYQDLFGAAFTGGGQVAARAELDRTLLDFMVDDVKRVNARLPASEKEKLEHYLEGFEALRHRRAKISAMSDAIAEGTPDADNKYTSEVETHRLEAHFDIAAAALVTGLTQVIAISTDTLETRYSGLGLGDYTVHALGHLEVNGNTGDDPNDWKDKDGTVEGRIARDKIRTLHMDLVAGLANKLAAVPEGNGTMLDNTLIVYFAHSGDRHHPNFFTWPIVTIGGLGGTLKTGNYLQYPSHGERGHHTLGNFYTTVLHAVGLPQKGFGHRDLQLGPEIDQECPLDHLLA